MWIQVDSEQPGVQTWIAPEHIERCDVIAAPMPPFAAVTTRSGSVYYVSEARTMKSLQKLLGVDLPKSDDL